MMKRYGRHYKNPMNRLFDSLTDKLNMIILLSLFIAVQCGFRSSLGSHGVLALSDYSSRAVSHSVGSFIDLRPKKSTYSIFLTVAPYSPSKNLPKKTKKVGVTMQKKYEHS